VAAVDSGADAVYLAGKRFGARHGAPNFDDPGLVKAIDYAHLGGVNVYVAVNTLIPEAEVEEVARRLVWLSEAGADAILVQDLGVLRIAREVVPDLELHASTQMTISSLEGARWAADAGLKRAVLARELTLAEVEEIARDAPIGVEVFVHGALCYSYSGQCLLSSVIGGRSGNRGMCAQPCRKPYRLLRGLSQDAYGRPIDLEAVPLKGRYLLSTKDLAVYPNLADLVRSPVEALKIEGRMRSPEYVRVVVSIYRRALDAISRGDWSPSDEDKRDLALAFNREFTAGCIGGADRRDLVSTARPDNRGLRIGRVVGWDGRRKMASVKIEGDLVPEQGDGLVIFSGGKEQGMVVRSSAGMAGGILSLATQEPVDKGAEVFITRRSGLGERLGQKAGPEIPIDLEVSWESGRPSLKGRVILQDGREVRSALTADFSMEPAKKRPLSLDQIEAQLRKTGGTPFLIRRVEMDYPGGLFAPLGEINRLRREFLERAEDAVTASFRPSDEEVRGARERLARLVEWRRTAPSSTPLKGKGSKPSISVYAETLETVAGAAEGGCRRVYFEPTVGIAPERMCRPVKTDPDEVAETLRLAKEICRGCNAELVWKLPRIARRRYLDFAFPLLERCFVKEVMVEGVGQAEQVISAAPEMRLSGSVGLNVWNSLAVEALAHHFCRLTLSPELSAREVEELSARSWSTQSRPDLEVIVQGNVEAMVAENCLLSSALGCRSVSGAGKAFWGIEDETGRVFPVRRDGECRTHVFNAVELSLMDQVPKLAEMGIGSIAIDARGRTAEYARRMAELYGEALDGGDLHQLKTEARKISMGGTTGGAFLRGRSE